MSASITLTTDSTSSSASLTLTTDSSSENSTRSLFGETPSLVGGLLLLNSSNIAVAVSSTVGLSTGIKLSGVLLLSNPSNFPPLVQTQQTPQSVAPLPSLPFPPPPQVPVSSCSLTFSAQVGELDRSQGFSLSPQAPEFSLSGELEMVPVLSPQHWLASCFSSSSASPPPP